MSAFIEYPFAKQKVKIASCSGCWQRSFRYSQHQNSSKNAKFWFMTTIWSCVKLWRRKPGTNKIYCSTNCHKIPHIQCLYTFIMPPGPQISPSSYESILCKNGYIHILFKPNNLYPIRNMKSQLGDKQYILWQSRTNYQFKMCLSLASLGMSSIIKEDVRVMEIWIDGHPEKYRLEAKNKKLKEEFAAELKKNILKAKENPSTSRTARQPQAVQVHSKWIEFRIYF